jgi:cytochrome P450
VARLEAHVLLTVLADRVRHLELVGEPVRGRNNTLTVWQSLPMRLHT